MLLRILLTATVLAAATASAADLTLNEREYFTTRGLDVLAFSNSYDGDFSDSKIAGVELIHHGVRTATNGDVRLSPTQGQCDPVPALMTRTFDKQTGAITERLGYAAEKFEYSVQVTPSGEGAVIPVILEQPLHKSMQGHAGFNLEFLPSAYFTKGYVMDDRAGAF